jgi:hypothetical protein
MIDTKEFELTEQLTNNIIRRSKTYADSEVSIRNAMIETQGLILSKVRSYLEGKEEDYGLLKISYEHEKTLRESCELALKERDKKLEGKERELEVHKEYIKLLGEELDELVPLAGNRGWKSTRYEAGKILREKIKSFAPAKEKEGKG